MITSYMNPRFFTQSNEGLSLLEHYQLYREVQQAKRQIRVEATVSLAKHERIKAKSTTNPNLGAKLDVYG